MESIQKALGALCEFGDWLSRLGPPPRGYWGGHCPLEQYLSERGAKGCTVFLGGILAPDDKGGRILFSPTGPYGRFVRAVDGEEGLWETIPTSRLVELWLEAGGEA